MRKYLWLILLLLAVPASALGECRGWYNEHAEQIGLYYKMDVLAPPTQVRSCGHWELDGKPAKVPNADLPSATYCRLLVEGRTFFAYHWRGMMDCSQVEGRLKFILEY